MVNRTFWKTCVRSVRSSFSRFFAIFAIVALGCGFLAGLLVTTPDRDIVRRIKMKTLKDAKVGETVTVAKLHGEGPVKRRIMDMGITKGVQIYVRKVAPLGDPMELTVRNYELSVRKADAEMIELV